jgi:dihydroorotate dehydrogenase (NAD+) catalytic subunit
LGLDGHFTVAAVDEDAERDALGPAEVEETVHGGANSAAGVKHVVHEDQVHAVHGKSNVRGLQDGLGSNFREVVAIERDVESADWHLDAIDSTHGPGDALGERHSPAADANEREVSRAAAFLNNLMGKALQSPVDLGSGHQLAFLDDAHVRVMLTQVCERKSELRNAARLDFLRRAGKLRAILLPSVSSPDRVDLSVQVGALRLTNPIIAAAGTFGYGAEFAHLVDLNRLGGLVTKGISREPIEGAPAPRLCETASGMLNAVGLQNVGVDALLKDKLPLLRKYHTHIIVNVFGYCLEEYVEVIRRLEEAEGISAFELNISCPNVKKGGMQFGSDPNLVGEVVAAARKAAGKKPMWVKLMPLVTDIGLIARAAEDAGADALTVANTYPAMAVEVSTGRSLLGNVTGGLSGPAIKPITLRLVWEVRKSVKIPIVGLGGIETAEDVLQYMAVGASAVQVGTASFADPKVSEEIVGGLEKALRSAKTLSFKEIRDKFLVENC